MATGVVLCIATVLGTLGRFSWILDLFSHFRTQYLFGLAIIGFLLMLIKHRKAATFFLIFSGINLAVILPLYFGGPPIAPEETPTLRAMLLNVNTRLGDADRVKQVIQKFDPDFVILEEINLQWLIDLKWLRVSHPYYESQTREDNFGIGLFSKLPLRDAEIVYIGEAHVPSIVAILDIGPDKLGIMATHPVPPGDAEYSKWRNDQLDRIPKYVLSNYPMLLFGDLNVTPWSHHFKRLLKRTGLRDSSQGQGVQPTWPNLNPLLRIPIDHCLHSPDILVTKKQIGPDVESDHYPVIIDFTINFVRIASTKTPSGKYFYLGMVLSSAKVQFGG